MAKKAESHGRRSAGERKAGSETAHVARDARQPTVPGQTSREEQRSDTMSGKKHAGHPSVAEMDDGAPSQQTSTAQDESGQV